MKTIQQQVSNQMGRLYGVIVLFSILLNWGWECNAQVSTKTLLGFYNNKAYDKVISYASEIEKSNNDTILTVLGDCYWEKAANDEEAAKRLYYQTLYQQQMAALQGLQSDVSTPYMIYQLRIQNVLQLRLKAVEVYSKASSLGNKKATQRLAWMSAMSGSSTEYSSGYNSGRSKASIQLDLKKAYEFLEELEKDKATISSVVLQMQYNQMIVDQKKRITELQTESRKATH